MPFGLGTTLGIVALLVGVVTVALVIHHLGLLKKSTALGINLLVVAAVLSIGPIVAITTAQTADTNLCQRESGSIENQTPDQDRPEPGAPDTRSAITLTDEAPVFDVGHDVNAGPLTIPFSLDKRVAGPRKLRLASPILRPTDQGIDELGRDEIRSWASLDNSRRSGSITLCFPPAKRIDGPSGAFAGNLLVTDTRLQRAEIPVTINLAYPKRDRVVFVGLAVCLLASMYVFFLRRPDLDDEFAATGDRMLRMNFSFFLGYWRFATSVLGVITIAAGLLGAAGAFSVQYLTSDNWAGEWTDWFAYVGAIGTAFIAGGTAGRLAQNVYDEDAAAAWKAKRASRPPGQMPRRGASRSRRP